MEALAVFLYGYLKISLVYIGFGLDYAYKIYYIIASSHHSSCWSEYDDVIWLIDEEQETIRSAYNKRDEHDCNDTSNYDSENAEYAVNNNKNLYYNDRKKKKKKRN